MTLAASPFKPFECRRIRRIPDRTRVVFAPPCEHRCKSGRPCKRSAVYQVVFALPRPGAREFPFYFCRTHRVGFAVSNPGSAS
jgi:hypothetical protein